MPRPPRRRSWRARLSGAVATARSSPQAALIPLRFFLGGTFLYAGVDKLISPGFFVAGAPGSIQQQLLAFARHSPIAGLVTLVTPFAIEVGFVVAVVEIGVGLGALSGYGFRLAAAGGLGLAILFWLTASWSTKPYYYGPDLPYAAAWLTLGLAGHGDLLVPARFRRPVAGPAGRPAGVEFAGRRAVLEAAALGTAAIVVAMVVSPLRRLGLGSTPDLGTGDALGGGTGTSPAPTTPNGVVVGTTADVAATGAKSFTIPFDAPAPLPAGDPAVIVRLADGTYVAFDAICTHAGCTVEWDGPDDLLVCPCHGAVFDPSKQGAAVAGPTNQPLAKLPLALDQATGRFILTTG